MTNFYLAAEYGRRSELQGYAKAIKDLGIGEVFARWLSPYRNDVESTATDAQRSGWARECMEDIRHCDVLVLFTPTTSRGGANFEAGFATALGREVCVVGPRTSVFTFCPEVECFYDFEEFVREISMDLKRVGS